jgi:hypothetical protein
MGQGKPKPFVFAAYYVWYRTGDHPRFPWWGWTRKEAESSPEAQKSRRPGEPPLASCAYPLAGLYDSADPEVAALHVQLAKAAGVDAFGFYSTFSHFRAHTYEEPAGKYRYLTGHARAAGKKMLLPVHPGHDNSRFNPTPCAMPRRDGQTLRDYLRAAEDAAADFILVTSWNEWPETTTVEPASTWPDPYLYLQLLAEWKGVRFVKPGGALRATKESPE